MDNRKPKTTVGMLRQATGLHQKEFVKRLGLTGLSYLSAIENGRRAPSLAFLRRCADEFHVPLAFMVGSWETESSLELLDKGQDGGLVATLWCAAQNYILDKVRQQPRIPGLGPVPDVVARTFRPRPLVQQELDTNPNWTYGPDNPPGVNPFNELVGSQPSSSEAARGLLSDVQGLEYAEGGPGEGG